MAGAGIGNPAGAVQVDGFDPLNFTFTARNNISGGAFVFASGGGTGSLLWAAGSLSVATDASGGNFTGIALQSALSGAAVPVALQGIFLLTANGTVIASNGVNCDGNNSVLPAGSETINNFTTTKQIGRALTNGTSGGFCAVFVRG